MGGETLPLCLASSHKPQSVWRVCRAEGEGKRNRQTKNDPFFPPALSQAVDLPLKIVQTAAIAEIAHSLLGVVKSPFFTTCECVLGKREQKKEWITHTHSP